MTKQIPKIALNYTKWKLQQKMAFEIRHISDQDIIAMLMAQYTKQFDLLEKLGADNCIDPEDFNKEDIGDDLFKNL